MRLSSGGCRVEACADIQEEMPERLHRAERVHIETSGGKFRAEVERRLATQRSAISAAIFGARRGQVVHLRPVGPQTFFPPVLSGLRGTVEVGEFFLAAMDAEMGKFFLGGEEQWRWNNFWRF